MNILANAGRITFAIPFMIFGVLHFMMASQMAGMVPGFIPGGVFWVYITGIAHLLAAIAIIINKWTKIAGILLAVMLFIFVLTIHIPAVAGGDQSAMTNLLKDTSLAGGALLIAGVFSQPVVTKTE